MYKRRILRIWFIVTLCVMPLSVFCFRFHDDDHEEEEEPWFKSSHEYRMIVWTGSRPESRTAYVEFSSGGRCREDGRDIIVTDDKDTDVNQRVIAIGPGDRFLVAFSMTDSSEYHVYTGSRTILAPNSTWYPRAGLLLKTYRRPKGSSDSVTDFMEMIRNASILDGAGYRDAVFDGYNPFGQSEDYLSVYSGYVKILKEGDYEFATNSDDSSMLFIDNKPIAKFLGLHGPSAVRGEKNGKIRLVAGIHKIDYFHVEYSGGQAAVAGWKKPGDKYFSLLPATAFVRIAPGRIRRIEDKKGPVADFRYRFGEIYPIGDAAGLVELKFRQFSFPNDEIANHKWVFGDGEISFEKNPSHVYAVPAIYSVSLLIQDKEKSLHNVTHRVPVYVNEGALSNSLGKTRKAFRKTLGGYSYSTTSATGLQNLLTFYSLEVDPDPVRIIFLCRQLLRRIPESDGTRRAPYQLRIAETMKYFPRLGDFRQRTEIYESVLMTARDGEYAAQAAYELGDIELFYTRDYGAAAGWYSKALSTSKDPELRRLAMIRTADISLYRGKLDEAKKAYEKIPPVRKDEKAGMILKTAYGQVVEGYMRKGKYKEALEKLDTWEWEYPEVKLDGYSFLLRIRINHKLNNLNEVTKYAYYILEVLDEESYKPETYYILISLLMQADKRESALQQFAKMKDAFPNSFYTKSLESAFEPDR